MLQQFDERNRDLVVNVGGRLAHRDEDGVGPFDSVVQGGEAVWEGLRLYDGAAGELSLSPSVLRRVVSDFVQQRRARSADPRFDTLSDREREVRGLIAQGLSNGAISERLSVRLATTKAHAASILTKFGARDRTQPAILACEHGLVRADDDEEPATGFRGPWLRL